MATTLMTNWAMTLREQGQPVEAERLLQRAAQIARRVASGAPRE